MEGLGVEVLVSESLLSNAPHCEHGPTLLFERNSVRGKRQFYACSACRSRKDCAFFQWKDAKVKANSAVHEQAKVHLNANSNSIQLERTKRLQKITKLSESQRSMCLSCSLLLFPEEVSNHSGHKLLKHITDKQLKLPSTLLQPLENDRKEAQYFFSSRTTRYLVSCLEELDVTFVVCVGCPRVHEYICNKSGQMQSLLLDLDSRFEQFYFPMKFCHYNVFNHHFFGGERGERSYNDFLKRAPPNGIAIILDPPFGGMVQPLALTVQLIQKDCAAHWNANGSKWETVPVLWVFPYFMEKKILSSLPSFTMLDYEIDYDNHSLFKAKTKKKRGSPIRIFTSVPASSVSPPLDEGYSFCKPCQRYVSENNRHCEICKECPSKDGRKYEHCEKCGCCVKGGYVHCATCNRCEPSDHSCGDAEPTTKSGCYVCGKISHKRKQCPVSQRLRLKRKKVKVR